MGSVLTASRRWRSAVGSWWRRRSRASRFAMKAAVVGLLVAVIVNFGNAQLPFRPAAQARQPAGSAEWRSTKKSPVTHLQVTPPVTASDLDYFANKLESHRNLREHVGNILIPRVSGTQGNKQVRQYISDQMKALDWTVDVVSHTQDTVLGKKVSFHNVVATLNPTAPRRLVLACHYDSLNKPRGFLGATDSAVPCAQMINLAHAMDRDLKKDIDENRNEVTLQFIFFDGEEAFVRWSRTDSTYGSRNLARVWEGSKYSYRGVSGTELDRMDVMVLLDLIGAANPTFISTQRKTQHHFNRMARIENDLRQNGSLRGDHRIFQQRPQYGANIEDDHIPFLERDVPILHLIVTPFPSVWHKASDNANAINYDDTEDINKILRVFVAEYLQLRFPRIQQSY